MATKEQRLEEMKVRGKAEILAGARFRTTESLARLYSREPNELKAGLEHAEARLRIFSIEFQGRALYPDYGFPIVMRLICFLQWPR